MRAHFLQVGLSAILTVACSDGALAPLPEPVTAFAHLGGDPPLIPLPDGFWPEGITFGRGSTFYVGSLATGEIWQGDARTGTGRTLVEPQAGVETVGMKYDVRSDRLFVAGGFTGHAFIYDATSGTQVAAYALGEPGASLVNDVVLTRDAAYLTDSFNDVLYRLPLGAGGSLPLPSDVEVIGLSGDYVSVETEIGNANGIVATPDGRQLVIVNTTTGALYRVDAATGAAAEIAVSGVSLEGGDGMLLIGNRLYVVLGHVNEIAELRMSPDLASAEIGGFLTSPDLQFPSTIAQLGSTLYAVNARFDVPPAPDVAYQVVALRR